MSAVASLFRLGLILSLRAGVSRVPPTYVTRLCSHWASSRLEGAGSPPSAPATCAEVPPRFRADLSVIVEPGGLLEVASPQHDVLAEDVVLAMWAGGGEPSTMASGVSSSVAPPPARARRVRATIAAERADRYRVEVGHRFEVEFVTTNPSAIAVLARSQIRPWGGVRRFPSCSARARAGGRSYPRLCRPGAPPAGVGGRYRLGADLRPTCRQPIAEPAERSSVRTSPLPRPSASCSRLSIRPPLGKKQVPSTGFRTRRKSLPGLALEFSRVRRLVSPEANPLWLRSWRLASKVSSFDSSQWHAHSEVKPA